ncbi:MAG: pilus assembly protein TadG-related protein [Vicinamibacterales bacterium]
MSGPTFSPRGSLIARLHRDDDGAISFLGVVGAAAFACLLLLIVNTGYATSGKIEMQNAADATAISGATWVARGLNVISMNNVTQTQLLAVALIIPALDDAMTDAELVLQVQEKACLALTVGAPACVAFIRLQISLLQTLHSFVRAGAGLARRPSGALWTAMKVLEGISAIVSTTFVGLAEIEADRIARQDGADLGMVVPAGLRLTLPTRKGALRPDLCDPTLVGSPSEDSRGYHPLLEYDVGQGPLELFAQRVKYPLYFFANSFVTIFFDAFRDANYRQLCGGSGPSRPAERGVNTLAECRAAGGGTAVWAVVQYETRRFSTRQPGISITGDGDPKLAGPPRSNPPVRRPCGWTPTGVRIGNGRYRSVQQITEPAGTDANGNNVSTYRYTFEDYMFLSAAVQSQSSSKSPTPTQPPSTSAIASDPNPYLLEDTAEDDLRYLAVVYRVRDVSVAPKFFKSPLGEHRVAYAQARVFNPTSFDLFTQDWRVTLEPASLIEDGSLLTVLASPIGNLGNVRNIPALDRFQQFSGVFDQLRSDLNILRYLNNH